MNLARRILEGVHEVELVPSRDVKPKDDDPTADLPENPEQGSLDSIEQVLTELGWAVGDGSYTKDSLGNDIMSEAWFHPSIEKSGINIEVWESGNITGDGNWNGTSKVPKVDVHMRTDSSQIPATSASVKNWATHLMQKYISDPKSKWAVPHRITWNMSPRVDYDWNDGHRMVTYEAYDAMGNGTSTIAWPLANIKISDWSSALESVKQAMPKGTVVYLYAVPEEYYKQVSALKTAGVVKGFALEGEYANVPGADSFLRKFMES